MSPDYQKKKTFNLSKGKLGSQNVSDVMLYVWWPPWWLLWNFYLLIPSRRDLRQGPILNVLRNCDAAGVQNTLHSAHYSSSLHRCIYRNNGCAPLGIHRNCFWGTGWFRISTPWIAMRRTKVKGLSPQNLTFGGRKPILQVNTSIKIESSTVAWRCFLFFAHTV